MAWRDRSPTHWERIELIIPLDVTYSAWLDTEPPAESRLRIERLILQSLRPYSRDGWQPEGRTDYPGLVGGGRVRLTRQMLVRNGRPVIRATSARISLRRAATGAGSP